MKKIKFLIILLSISVSLIAGNIAKYPDLPNGLYADIKTDKGDILLELYYKNMPLTVANFVALAEGNHPKVTDSLKGKKYYDQTKFHRVIKNFMIQGGDYCGTGAGSAGYKFADEFPLNEEGELLYKHDKAGVLSMANSGPETNSSQFFITHKDTPWLNGKHSVFGKVYSGQKVVDAIEQNDAVKYIKIIRVGKEAKKFNAPKVFLLKLKEVAKIKEAELKKMEAVKKKFQEEMGILKASKTDSGLGFLQLKKGTSKKVNPDKPTTVHYTLFTDTGKKIDSSLDRNEPITFVANKDPLIKGWKEGIKMMHEGEKARLFIPHYLGYGDEGYGKIIPAKSDLIFELEVIKVE